MTYQLVASDDPGGERVQRLATLNLPWDSPAGTAVAGQLALLLAWWSAGAPWTRLLVVGTSRGMFPTLPRCWPARGAVRPQHGAWAVATAVDGVARRCRGRGVAL